MNIIPTPQFTKFSFAESGHVYKKALPFTYCDNDLQEKIKITSSFLGEFNFISVSEAKLIITKDSAIVDSFGEIDYKWFNNKNATEQGYIIKGFKDGKILIFAKENQGILYALSTLSQLENIESEFEIKDYPDFKYRGNKWLMWAETGVWSYDTGDGIDAIKERVIRKLDVCLRYKINLLIFDAWGFDTKRFEGYEKFMRDMNHEARKRGIFLSSNGYTMGYGMSGHQFGKHTSKVFKNQKSYPDGEVYECLGTFFHDDRNDGKPFILAREFGTCISNDVLTDLKLDELREYIRKVQPGALYLHNMDSYLIDPIFWDARCEECRKKWPSDDLYAPDGMAGAFAYFFDKLNGGLKDICIGDYNSSKDMIIFNVSPGYMWYFIPDSEVLKATKFWEAVLKYSKVTENVYPVVRELYYNLDNGKKRIPDIIAPALGGRCGVINFSGSDGFYTDKLFFVSGIFNTFFKGADAIMSSSGHYFQEPLQIFNAEYMWNCDNSSFYNPENIPENYEEFMKLYFDAQKTAFRPEEVYGEGGFLDIICKKLYGDEGEKASQMFKLCGKNYECPIPYPCNKEMHTAGNDVSLKYRWNTILEKEELDSLLSSFGEMDTLTKQACEILKDCKNIDLKEYHKMLTLTSPIVSMWHSYLKLYKNLSEAFDGGEPEKYLDEIQNLLNKAEEKHREHIDMNFEITDVMGGALAKREEMFVLMKTNLDLMKESIKTGKRLPEDKSNSESEIWW